MAIAAFFDLDRTVIDVNSAVLWAQHERRNHNISLRQFVQATFWTALYHFSVIDVAVAYTKALIHYKGVGSDELDARTRAWFDADVAHHVRPGASEAFEAHRQQGHKLVLLTSSSCYEADAATQRWALDGWLANVFETDAAGRLTGHFEAPLCYGEGKVVRARAWAERHGVELDACYFYTDSLSDLPMLERVGEPRIVHPDPRLRRVARQRGWPILTW